MSLSLRSLAALRGDELRPVLDLGGRCTVAAYARRVGCSTATARARLNRLADDGCVRRFRVPESGRGGAYLYEAAA